MGVDDVAARMRAQREAAAEANRRTRKNASSQRVQVMTNARDELVRAAAICHQEGFKTVQASSRHKVTRRGMEFGPKTHTGWYIGSERNVLLLPSGQVLIGHLSTTYGAPFELCICSSPVQDEYGFPLLTQGERDSISGGGFYFHPVTGKFSLSTATTDSDDGSKRWRDREFDEWLTTSIDRLFNGVTWGV